MNDPSGVSVVKGPGEPITVMVWGKTLYRREITRERALQLAADLINAALSIKES